MKQARLFALDTLPESRHRQYPSATIAQSRQGIDFRHGGGQAFGFGLETNRIINTAGGERVEAPADAGQVVVEQGRDNNNFCNFAGQEFADIGFAASLGAVQIKFHVTGHQIAQEGIVVGDLGVVASVCASSQAHLVVSREVVEAGGLQILQLLIPDDEFFGEMLTFSERIQSTALTTGRTRPAVGTRPK